MVAFYITLLGLFVSIFPILSFFNKSDSGFMINFERADEVYRKGEGYQDLKVIYKGVEVNGLYRAYYKIKNETQRSYKGQDVKGEAIYKIWQYK